MALFEAQIHWRKAPKFVIPRSEATWESPAAGYVFAEAYLLFNMVLRDCHVGLRPPRNDKSGSFRIPFQISVYYVLRAVY